MDKIQGAIRVAAAYVAGALLTWLAQWLGLDFGEETSEAMIQTITFLFSVGYYIAVRFLAERFPFLEALLIVPRSPVYVKPQLKDAAEQRVRELSQ